jgi:hypothetical protein
MKLGELRRAREIAESSSDLANDYGVIRELALREVGQTDLHHP